MIVSPVDRRCLRFLSKRALKRVAASPRLVRPTRQAERHQQRGTRAKAKTLPTVPHHFSLVCARKHLTTQMMAYLFVAVAKTQMKNDEHDEHAAEHSKPKDQVMPIEHCHLIQKKKQQR